MVECKIKQYGKQQYLQNVIVGKCVNDVCWDDIYNEGDNVLVFCLIGVNCYCFCIKCCWIDVYFGIRLYDVNDDKINNQCDGIDNFKVKQCDCVGMIDCFYVFYVCNVCYDGIKDDRSDDYFNEFNEVVVKWFYLFVYFRIEMVKENINGYCCQDLKVKVFKQRGFYRVFFSKIIGFVRLWGICGFKIIFR